DDIDADGRVNAIDNCAFSPNVDQLDSNGNGIGDVCDPLTTAVSDLSISVTGPTIPAEKNIAFDYQITVSNAGPGPANSVSVKDSLPGQVSFVSSSPSQGTCTGTTNVVCALGAIPSGVKPTIVIRVVPTVTGQIDNFADVTLGTGSSDPNILNN